MNVDRLHLESRAAEFLRAHRLLAPGTPDRPGTHFLVAASGGCDSTVLAHIMANLAAAWNCSVSLATVHHGLRPEADAELAFVRDLAAQLGTGFLSRHVDVQGEALRTGATVQDTARRLRYQALEEMCNEAGASVILTAHHADDQAETLLAHFLRGAGPDGLAGIRPVRGRVARPLLAVTQQQIREWAEARDIAWMHDASNDSDKYRRNALRHHVTPEITSVLGPGWVGAVGDSARLFESLATFLRAHTAELVRRCVDHDGGTILVRGNSLNDNAEFEKLMVCRFTLFELRGTEATLEESFTLLRLLDAQPGSTALLREGITAVRDQTGLRLLQEEAAPPPVAVEPASDIRWGAWRFTAEDLGGDRPAFSSDPTEELIDLDAAGARWRLRPWTEADRFEPLGFGREKTVGDFLADGGYVLARRRRIPVLTGEHGIIWVCGVRLAQHAAVRPETRHVGRLRFLTNDRATHDI
ncbi:MAG: tRNA lysidine(34) synthetase TilS [Bacteroidetes bacterium]|nr:tRNA lysidine(34) synthetase TilS [Bacteroidota bacterium]